MKRLHLKGNAGCVVHLAWVVDLVGNAFARVLLEERSAFGRCVVAIRQQHLNDRTWSHLWQLPAQGLQSEHQ